MPMNFLGKVLFPNQPEWRGRRQAKHLVAALVVAVIFGAVVVTVMFVQNSRR
jgi:hypothetical protein